MTIGHSSGSVSRQDSRNKERVSFCCTIGIVTDCSILLYNNKGAARRGLINFVPYLEVLYSMTYAKLSPIRDQFVESENIDTILVGDIKLSDQTRKRHSGDYNKNSVDLKH